MSTPNIIAVGIVIVAFLVGVGITIYKASKQNKTVTFDDFIDQYGDQTIKVLQDSIAILQINADDFADKESYEKAIISTTIDKLKENSKEFGIDQSVVNLFDSDALTNLVYTILNKNTIEVFSCLGGRQIADNTRLYDDEVVEALTNTNAE